MSLLLKLTDSESKVEFDPLQKFCESEGIARVLQGIFTSKTNVDRKYVMGILKDGTRVVINFSLSASERLSGDEIADMNFLKQYQIAYGETSDGKKTVSLSLIASSTSNMATTELVW